MYNQIPMKDVPDGVQVTDNGGPNKGGTHDRFTVIMPDGAVYSMSTNAMAESGVCLFQGNGYKADSSEETRTQIPLHVFQKIEELLT